ncbi:MAG: SufD family Fe-S cluster assembly protein, partial [Candidatus Omnitrophica bacterium]|nr:SufD family Fe-S cluster assembly protein [Candidatus Omnitrophota bacterium]MBD3269778.1 SufD family Fe-S cluster assembly protein [Candidatus Omnitrophota bacterium]
MEKNISPQDKEKIASSGMDFSEETRSGSFLQEDSRTVISRSLHESVDILGTPQALEEYPQIKSLKGQAFSIVSKDFPRDTEGGYYIRVKKGKRVELPIQACLFLKAQGYKQKVHNLIIIEEGASLHLITGCSASKASREGFHLGVSEFFIKKGGYLNFTMIHSWKEDTSVKPMSVAVLEEGATFISNYVCLRPVKEVKMYPTAVLRGRGSRASFNSFIMSYPETLQDIGSRVIFKAPDTSAEVVSRTVTLGGKVVARGHLKAEKEGIKGHLECRGMVLSEKGIVHAIPELETELRDVDLSHEAAIGKIDKEEIEYLCSRGLTAQQAQSIIIRGF